MSLKLQYRQKWLLDYCNSLHFGEVIKAVQDVHADVQVKRILRCTVQVVRWLDELRPQRIEENFRDFHLPVVTFWQGAKPQPQGIVHSVKAYRFLQISG